MTIAPNPGICSSMRLPLAPLTFEEAVTDILKIKPEPKPPKKRPKAGRLEGKEAGK
jgi:hypothetical protein